MEMRGSIATWRDQPVRPVDYGDLGGLVRCARNVRGITVDFDWVLKKSEVEDLRAEIYRWGTGAAGRYRYFDSMVLAAMNGALGDANSEFNLSSPESIDSECRISCSIEGDVAHLRGAAPFDVVLGYGLAIFEPSASRTPAAGSALREISDAVATLGWDLAALQEPGLKRVLNALYGLPLDYGLPPQSFVGEPLFDVPVHFRGPFSAFESDRCLFTDEVGAGTGVYLWTIQVRGREWPWYVGQTRRRFDQRTAEHIAGFLSGQYEVCDPDALSQGRYRLAPGAPASLWPRSIPALLQRFDILGPAAGKVVRLLRFHFAPLNEPSLYNRIEGAIGRHYKSHEDVELREFFGTKIKLPAAIPSEAPIRLLLSSEGDIAGLPQQLLA